jgi:hypothetical protein
MSKAGFCGGLFVGVVVTALCMSLEEVQLLSARAVSSVGLRDDLVSKHWMTLGPGTAEYNGVCMCSSKLTNKTFAPPPIAEARPTPNQQARLDEARKRMSDRKGNSSMIPPKPKASKPDPAIEEARKRMLDKAAAQLTRGNCQDNIKTRLTALISDAIKERQRIEKEWDLTPSDMERAMTPSPSNATVVR